MLTFPKRLELLMALRDLDDEAFNFLVAQMGQLAKERGGFQDKRGLARLERECTAYLAASVEIATPQKGLADPPA